MNNYEEMVWRYVGVRQHVNPNLSLLSSRHRSFRAFVRNRFPNAPKSELCSAHLVLRADDAKACAQQFLLRRCVEIALNLSKQLSHKLKALKVCKAHVEGVVCHTHPVHAVMNGTMVTERLELFAKRLRICLRAKRLTQKYKFFCSSDDSHLSSLLTTELLTYVSFVQTFYHYSFICTNFRTFYR